METSFTELKEKEIINLNNGKKLGRIIDIIFENQTGKVQGILLPGDKKLFHKADNIFVPLQNLKKIGDDVILINIFSQPTQPNYVSGRARQTNASASQGTIENSIYQSKPTKSFIRYRRIDNSKYN